VLNAIIIAMAVVLARYVAFAKRLAASSTWKAMGSFSLSGRVVDTLLDLLDTPGPG